VEKKMWNNATKRLSGVADLPEEDLRQMCADKRVASLIFPALAGALRFKRVLGMLASMFAYSAIRFVLAYCSSVIEAICTLFDL
jgi:hypothetical protein